MPHVPPAQPEPGAPTLSLRPHEPRDDFTHWRWQYGEENPEWKLWDGPYFPRPAPLSWEAYQERQRAQRPITQHPVSQNPAPHRQAIALGGECIGLVTRSEETPQGGGWWELGLAIYDPAHWGLGLGSQVLRLWTDATFRDTPAHVLTLTTWSGNQRMIRAALRGGYHECARIPEARLWQGQRWDSVKLACLRRSWAPVT